MMMLGSGLILASAFLLVRGQETLTITVGQPFYEPQFGSLLNGGVVEFQFTAGRHGVTQTSGPDNPCSQMEGGFNSGLIPGYVGNDSLPSPSWTLTITNQTAPIFFYCAATLPSFHCAEGMVGAINAPPDQFTSLSLAAKSVTGTPVQTSSVVLAGIGASASAFPVIPTLSPQSSATSAPTSSVAPSSQTPSSSSAFPSETAPSTQKSSSSNAAAIGGGIGGAAAVCIIAILGFLLFRARRHRSVAAVETPNEKFDLDGRQGARMNDGYHRDPFQNTSPLPYNHTGSSRGFANQDSGPVGIAGNYSQQHMRNDSDFEPYPRNTTYTQDSTVVPSRPPTEPPLSGGLPGQEFGAVSGPGEAQASTFQPQPHYPAAMQSPNLDVHELAKEVATLLRPQLLNANTPPSASPPPGTSRMLPNPHAKAALANEDNLPPRSPGPPQYDQHGRL